jgi:hypothetical protein
MSFLHPLLLAGLAAVAAPVILHLIRRHPRNRVTFSSLMFLRSAEPRLRYRSRLEHIPLLILRCAALCLLAFAFARPFVSRPAVVGETHTDKRIVLLVDTSGSMRRDDMWTKALDEAKSVLASAGPTDRACVMSFDQVPRTLVGFDQWRTMDPSRRAAVAESNLSELSPGWAATNSGPALIAAAEAIEDDEVNDARHAVADNQIVLVSDLQQGSRLDALTAYEWPRQTQLIVKMIACPGAANASMQRMTGGDSLTRSDDAGLPGIRVTNSSESDKDRFQLRWGDEPPMDVYVPPGHSVVVHPPAGPDQPASRVVLTGDDQDFDDTLYLAPQPQRKINVLYVGNDDPNDTTEMLYYVRRAFEAKEASNWHVIVSSADRPIDAGDVETAHAIIVTDPPGRQNGALLRRHLESGGALLFAPKSADAVAALSDLAGITGPQASEADVGRYAMLDRMEFEHPLLKPFSDPRFADFARIHFWKYRRVDVAALPGARVLAWFDSDDPAWLEIAVGRGMLLVWTSGWSPSDSDLALSSKFVPLLYGILEQGGALAQRPSQYFVGDPVPMSSEVDLEVRKPDGSIARVAAGQQSFSQTDLPGVYTLALPSGDQRFAVNLSPEESRTDPMPVENLERMGVSLKPTSDVRVNVASANPQSAITNPQSRQEFWRWVLTAVLLALLAETWLAGRLARRGPETREEQP